MSHINENLVSIFTEVKSKLNSCKLLGERKAGIDYLLKMLYEIWGKHIKSNIINYNCLAPVFNRTFFLKNFLKNLLFFEEYYDLVGDSILDVGCGAAPVSIAISSLAKIKKSGKVSIDLVDKSKNQLDIANEFFRAISIEANSYVEDSFEIEQEKYEQLVVFSYFFCEQRKKFLESLFNNRNRFTGGFVIIDYKENIVMIKKYFEENGDDGIISTFLNYNLPENLSEVIREKEVSVYGCYYKP